jgi:hypothetical protein
MTISLTLVRNEEDVFQMSKGHPQGYDQRKIGRRRRDQNIDDRRRVRRHHQRGFEWNQKEKEGGSFGKCERDGIDVRRKCHNK